MSIRRRVGTLKILREARQDRTAIEDGILEAATFDDIDEDMAEMYSAAVAHPMFYAFLMPIVASHLARTRQKEVQRAIGDGTLLQLIIDAIRDLFADDGAGFDILIKFIQALLALFGGFGVRGVSVNTETLNLNIPDVPA